MAPIYATLTPTQVLYILNDSGAKVIFVSEPAQATKLAEIRTQAPQLEHVIRMDEAAGRGRAVPGGGPAARARGPGPRTAGACGDAQPRCEPGDLATLIYTSGTTGDPKGVMLIHSNLVSNVLAAHRLLPDIGTRRRRPLLPAALPRLRADGRLLPHVRKAGATIAYAESVEKVPENMREVRPTIMLSVPRLYEKMYARVHREGGRRPAAAPADLPLGHGRRPRGISPARRPAQSRVRS